MYSVSKEKESELSIESMQKILESALEFPVYVAQDKYGQWSIVQKNHYANAEIRSMEELVTFANEYAFQDD